MIKKNKQKGFSQIELVLIIGIVLLITMFTYSTYNKKAVVSQTEKQVVLIEFLMNSIIQTLTSTSSKTEDTAETVTKITELTTGISLVNNRLAPNDMINSSSNGLKTVWGNDLTVEGVPISANGVGAEEPGFKIDLKGVPSFACSLLATNYKLAEISIKIEINSTEIKNATTQDLDVAQVADLCKQDENNLTIYKNAFKAGVDGSKDVTSVNAIRKIDNKYHIGAISQNAKSDSPSCIGNATFNAAQATCVCPAATPYWTGYECVADKPGFCPLGQGWDLKTKVCKSLEDFYTAGRNPSSNDPIICPIGITDKTNPYCVTSAPVTPDKVTPILEDGSFLANRMIPQILTTEQNADVLEKFPKPTDPISANPSRPTGFTGKVNTYPQIQSNWYKNGTNTPLTQDQCQFLAKDINNPTNTIEVALSETYNNTAVEKTLPIMVPHFAKQAEVVQSKVFWDGKSCLVCIVQNLDATKDAIDKDRCVTPKMKDTNQFE